MLRNSTHRLPTHSDVTAAARGIEIARGHNNYATQTVTGVGHKRQKTSLRHKMSTSSFLLTLLAAFVLEMDLAASDSDIIRQLANIAVATRTTTTLPAEVTYGSGNLSPSTLSSSTIAARETTRLHNVSTPSQILQVTSAVAAYAPPHLTTLILSLSTPTSDEASTTTLSNDLLVYNASLADDGDDSDEDDAANSLEQPISDSLTKGFSIPTFLPPFPSFAVADLPTYVTSTDSSAAAAPSLSPEDIVHNQLQHGDQLYLAAAQHNKPQAPKRNLTMPATNVSVQIGSHAYMPCHIRRLMNKPVSWVRVRDGHILSVDQTTFIADQRFQSIFKGEHEYTWSLQIKYVQPTDEGWYECQVSTEPKMSAKVYLSVVVPITELIGDQNRFVKAGSKVALHCIVRGTLEQPTYIIWFRGKAQIADDNKLGWYTQIDRTIFGNTSDNQNTIGSLIIPFVRKHDSGNYTCQPSNSASVSVDLHVLSGEYSASAIMSTGRRHTFNAFNLLLVLLLPLMVPQRKA